MVNQFFCKLLTSRRLLFDCYLQGKLPDISTVMFDCYIGIRNENICLPDHALKNAQAVAMHDVESFAEVLHRSLIRLSGNYLKFETGFPFVKNGKLEEWQNLITKVSPVALVSAGISGEFSSFSVLSKKQVHHRVCEVFTHSTLPSPKDVQLEHLMLNEGACDLHIHINGTSEAAFFWQHALNRPSVYGQLIEATSSKKTLKEFYAEHGMVPHSLGRLLHLAAWLRATLTTNLFKKSCTGPTNASCRSGELPSRSVLCSRLVDSWYVFGDSLRHPLAEVIPSYDKFSDVALDALMLTEAFWALERNVPEVFSYMLHCYLLIQHVYMRFVVQQLTQNGFDQFQKITLNQLRDEYEDIQTVERFSQLKSMYGWGVSHIEGRFSPKDTAQKNNKLLSVIKEGYEQASKNGVSAKTSCNSSQEVSGTSSSLRLVAHFIKRPDEKEDVSCWHYSLRRDNARRATELIKTIVTNCNYSEKITGIDAAANELHTSPEVYAPIFRFFRAHGFSNFTYHVGEDFRHLLSGLRAVDEALTFLELSSGNRIGHGTALGIDPKLWHDAIGDTVWIPQGEWLDNLIWLHAICQNSAELQHLLGALQVEIESLFYQIFGKDEVYQLSALIKAWQLRGLDPFAGLIDDNRGLLLESEKLAVDSEKNINPQAVEYLKKYHSSRWRDVYKKKIAVPTVGNIITEELLRSVQDILVIKLNHANCLVEVMPTSNLRISFYQQYDEHHMFEWLNESIERPVPAICIATDDPGIFSTNLRNELGLVVEVLRRKYCNGDNDKPYEIVKGLLQNARSYCFKKSPLTPFFER